MPGAGVYHGFPQDNLPQNAVFLRLGAQEVVRVRGLAVADVDCVGPLYRSPGNVVK